MKWWLAGLLALSVSWVASAQTIDHVVIALYPPGTTLTTIGPSPAAAVGTLPTIPSTAVTCGQAPPTPLPSPVIISTAFGSIRFAWNDPASTTGLACLTTQDQAPALVALGLSLCTATPCPQYVAILQAFDASNRSGGWAVSAATFQTSVPPPPPPLLTNVQVVR